jgi:hypothetical protein
MRRRPAPHISIMEEACVPSAGAPTSACPRFSGVRCADAPEVKVQPLLASCDEYLRDRLRSSAITFIVFFALKIRDQPFGPRSSDAAEKA